MDSPHVAREVLVMSKLSAEHTTKCQTCKHGKAAHKGACRMKHCKCVAFK